MSLISLGTAVKYPGEIGNNGYAKFWEVNKVHCIMVYVKMVACTFLRMYVKVHWNFNVPFRNEQLFLHFLALSFRFSTKHLPMRITFGRKYAPSTKFHQLKKICQDLTVQYKIYQFVGVRGTPSKMSPIVFMWWYLSSHIYIYFLFSSWRIF